MPPTKMDGILKEPISNDNTQILGVYFVKNSPRNNFIKQPALNTYKSVYTDFRWPFYKMPLEMDGFMKQLFQMIYIY